MEAIFNANGDTQPVWGDLKQESPEQYLNPTHSLSGTSNDHSPYTDLSSDPNLHGDAPGLFAQDDSWAYGGYDIGDEQGDAKRRRIARACDSCRRKKIKCDAKMPKCSHCENYNNECVFTHVEKKRAPPKGAKYIEGLENRLGRMEHLLRLSGLLNDDDDGGDLGVLEQRLAQQVNGRKQSPKRSASGNNSTKRESDPQDGRRSTPLQSKSAVASGRSSPRLQHGDQKAKDRKIDKDEEVNDLADMMWCSLMTNSSGETRFIGSSSGFSIFSPKGIEWVNSRTGDDSFKDMIAHISEDEAKWYPWREEVFNDIFARKIFQPLPPREECESLMTEFFESFNRMFPLFHEPTFMHLIDMQYSANPYEGSGWWACLNISLAIAHRIRMIKTQNIQEHEGQSWAYFKNSLAVLSELTMRNTDMLSIQALVGMCLFLQGSPNPQPAFFLISAAIRLSHSIGLHKHGSGFGLNPAEVEQRKRVFWIAYMIDKDISIRSGRPPAQDDDDWNVDLPSEDPDDGVGTVPLADGSKSNLFLVLCNYAVINAKVYNKLYSVKAARQSDGELLTTIGELDVELEAWKNSIPIDFRPEHDLSALPPQLVIHIVILHFSYYNCLATIHRRSVHHGYWTSRLSNFAAQGLNVKPLNPRVFSSAALCVSAARTTIHLIKYIPPSDYAFVWLILYYPTSAMVTIFANILQNPQDARARSDLKLINFFVLFLERVSAEDATGSLKRMWLFTSQLERIASIVLDRAEKDMTSGQKRKQEREREKIAKRPNDSVEIPQPTRNSLEVQRPAEGFPYYAKPAQAQQQQQQHRSSSDPSANNRQTFKEATMQATTQQQGFQPQPFVDLIDPVTAPRPSYSSNFTPISSNTPMSSHAQNGQNYGNNNMHGPFSSDLMASAFDNSNTEASSPENCGPNLNWSGLGPGYTFQQPMVPQELWNMPMTFEWDWAMPENMSSLGMSPNLGMGMNQMPSYDMNSFDLSGTTMNGMGQDQSRPQQQQQQLRSNNREEGRPY